MLPHNPLWISDDILKRAVQRFVEPVMSPMPTAKIFEPSVTASLVALLQELRLQGLNLGRYKKFLFPLNILNSHWVVVKFELVGALPHVLECSVFDSSKGDVLAPLVDEKVRLLKATLIRLIAEDETAKLLRNIPWKDTELGSLPFYQQNGNDCGVFAYDRIRSEALDIPPASSQADIDATRHLLFALNITALVPHQAFLAFSDRDCAPIASNLHSLLRRGGSSVFWHAEVPAGKELLPSVVSQLSQSILFVCLLTRNFFDNGWTLMELHDAFLREISGHCVIAPVFIDVEAETLVQEFSERILSYPPTFPRGISLNTVILAVKRVVEIKGQSLVAKNITSANYTELSESISGQLRLLTRERKLLSEVVPVPPRVVWNHPFLVSAAEAIQSHRNRSLRLAFVGMGGIGKSISGSLIARALMGSELIGAATFLLNLGGGGYEDVVWLEFSDVSNGCSEARKLLAQLLGTPVDRIAVQDIDLVAKIKLSSHGRRYVIVLDNISSDKAVADQQLKWFKDVEEGCCIIATSRNRESFAGYTVFDLAAPVVVKDETWSAHFLRYLIAGFDEVLLSEIPLPLCSEIANSVGGLPLILSAIAQTTKKSPLETLEALQNFRKSLNDSLQAFPSESTLSLQKAAIALTISSLETIKHSDGDVPVVKVLQALAGFPGDVRVPFAVFQPVLTGLGFNASVISRGIEIASGYSFIERYSSGDVRMHSIFRDHFCSDAAWAERRMLFVGVLEEVLATRDREFAFSDLIRISEYLRFLGGRPDIEVPHEGDPFEHTDSLLQAATHIAGLALQNGDMKTAVKSLGMLMDLIKKPNNTGEDWPSELQELFEELRVPNASLEKVNDLLSRLSKEYLGAGTRPHFAINLGSLWSDRAPEAFGVTHLACFAKRPDLLKALLAAGACVPSIAEGYSTQRTEIFISSDLGDLESVKVLIEHGCVDSRISSCSSVYGVSHLLLDDAAASDPGMFDRKTDLSNIPGGPGLQHLLDNSTSWSYLHAIHIAIIRDHVDIVNILLEKGAANVAHASLGLGWIDVGILHRKEAALLAVLTHLLNEGAKTVPEIIIQCPRYEKGDLPPADIAWFDALGGPLGEKIVQLKKVVEANRVAVAERDRVIMDNGGIDVIVKTLAGKTIRIAIPADATVEDLKARVLQKEGIQISAQRMIFNGKQLEDSRTLKDNKIGDESVVHLVLSLIGGEGAIPF